MVLFYSRRLLFHVVRNDQKQFDSEDKSQWFSFFFSVFYTIFFFINFFIYLSHVSDVKTFIRYTGIQLDNAKDSIISNLKDWNCAVPRKALQLGAYQNRNKNIINSNILKVI